jgi:hypothetical protein
MAITNIKIMDSRQLARYMEATDGIAKPWLLVQLRLKKLQERQALIPEDDYAEELQDIFQDMMNLGEWWRGIEDQVF